MKKAGSRGSLTVETLLFLIPFMFAFLVVLNFSREIEAEMIIHHAISQTAKEISTYSYVLTKTGITSRMQNTNGKSTKFKNDTKDVVDSLTGFAQSFGSGNMDNIIESGNNAAEKTEEYFSDPGAIATGVLSVFKSGATQYAMTTIAGQLAKSSIRKQVELIGSNANEYLINLGVVNGLDGLDFSKSRINSNSEGKGNVDIVVTYKVTNNVFPYFDIGEKEVTLSASTWAW